MNTKLESVLLTLWVGGLWAIGYIAVPTLFYELDDRQLAGDLAGRMFQAIHFIGLFCALLLLAGLLYRYGRQALRQWRAWVLLTMFALTLLGLFVLQPMMVDIKAHSGWAQQTDLAASFGRLHGIASLFYLLMSLMGLSLTAVNGKR